MFQPLNHPKSTLALMATALLLTSACGTIEEGVAEAIADTKRAALTGGDVLGKGDPDGFASAELSISDRTDQICYDVNDMRGLGNVTGAAIYRGAKGRSGTLVMRLREANEGGWKNCVKRAEWLEDSIEASSGGYFIQLVTSDYPGGAVRGQFY